MNQENIKIPAVSIVVPVYNGEKFLPQMMESVCGQTLKNIEIICVDDGSTDRTWEILQKFRERDSRVLPIRQEHTNAGAARNTGMQKAKGEYLAFWDADDFFAEKALERMYGKARKKEADLCVCSVYEVDWYGGKEHIFEAEPYLRQGMLPEKDPFDKYDIPESIFNFSTNVLWNKLFRRRFVLDRAIQFQSISQANDTAFVMFALFLAKKITHVKDWLVYHRTYNKDSITGQSSDTVYDPYEAYAYTLRRLKEQKNFGYFRKSYLNRAAKGMFRVLDTQQSLQQYEDFYLFLQKEGLENLEISRYQEEDLEEPWMYRDLENMKKLSACEFLLYKAHARKLDRDRLRHTLGRVKRRLGFLISFSQFEKKVRAGIRKGRGARRGRDGCGEGFW